MTGQKELTGDQIFAIYKRHEDKPGNGSTLIHFYEFARAIIAADRALQGEHVKRLIEAAEAVLSNEDHAVSCGARQYQKGSPTWEAYQALRAAIQGATE